MEIGNLDSRILPVRSARKREIRLNVHQNFLSHLSRNREEHQRQTRTSKALYLLNANSCQTNSHW